MLELNGDAGLSGPAAGTGDVRLSPGVKVAPLEGLPFFAGVAGSVPLDESELDARVKLSLFYHFR